VLQRAEIERLASAGLSHPTDLFTLSGNELADYLTDAGTVDAEKVAADVAAILQERPGLKPLSPAYDRTQGMSGNPSRPTSTFGDLLPHPRSDPWSGLSVPDNSPKEKHNGTSALEYR